MYKENDKYIGRYISQIHRKGAAYISKGLSDYGIGYGQFMFLIQLYRGDGISQEELAEKLNIDKGTTARAVKKLEEKGLLIRSIDEEDKRAYKIYVTDSGVEIKDKIFSVVKGWEKNLTSNLTSEEKGNIIKLLEKICMK